MSKIELLVVLPVGVVMKEGDVYGSTPFHCTLMQWFRLTESKLKDLKGELEWLTAGYGPDKLELVSCQRAMFDPDGQVPVHVLVENPGLRALHEKLLAYLIKAGAEVLEWKWVGDGYRPHVTDQPPRVFAPGERCFVDSLVLIQREANRDKRVLQVCSL